MKRMILIGVACLAGCATNPGKDAPVVHLERAVEGTVVHLAEPLEVELGRQAVDLPAGGWRLRGTIPQGSVYKSVDSVLIVGRGNGYEAYVVVAEQAVQGVYLPYEKKFIEAREPVAIALIDQHTPD
jgi:hypothetical protein